MAKLTVQVDPELLKRLRLVSVKEEKTVSEIVRGLVLAYVQRREMS